MVDRRQQAIEPQSPIDIVLVFYASENSQSNRVRHESYDFSAEFAVHDWDFGHCIHLQIGSYKTIRTMCLRFWFVMQMQLAESCTEPCTLIAETVLSSCYWWRLGIQCQFRVDEIFQIHRHSHELHKSSNAVRPETQMPCVHVWSSIPALNISRFHLVAIRFYFLAIGWISTNPRSTPRNVVEILANTRTSRTKCGETPRMKQFINCRPWHRIQWHFPLRHSLDPSHFLLSSPLP